MGFELILGFTVGIATPSAARKAWAKIRPWLGRLLKSLMQETDG
jgi:hypothetical protein